MSEDNNKDSQNHQNGEITLEKLQADLDQAINGWKRTAADFENYKKRREAQEQELVEFAKEITVAKLLPTLDSLEQALRHAPPKTADSTSNTEFGKQYENWLTGINGILLQLDKVLEELGVKRIEAVGKKFDPHLHEAVREVEGEAEDGTVVEELQSGFMLNGKVIRPSQVIINKKKLNLDN